MKLLEKRASSSVYRDNLDRQHAHNLSGVTMTDIKHCSLGFKLFNNGTHLPT